jgi:hypothetical protein
MPFRCIKGFYFLAPALNLEQGTIKALRGVKLLAFKIQNSKLRIKKL